MLCISKLLEYSFEVLHKPGRENKAADALSRVPPVVHLNQLTAPNILDTVVIKEVGNDEKLQKIREELEEKGEGQETKFSLKQYTDVQRPDGDIEIFQVDSFNLTYLP